MPAKEMLNYAEFLPSEGPDHFVLAGRVFPIPTYESAEQLVELMVAAGVVRLDDVVGAALDPKSYAGDRTAQRHFKQTTGLTRSFLGQIRRAQEAVKQLQSGKKPADVAADLGYTDQAHLYKSIRRIMNTRPTDVDHINKV
jgi:methylphosphotriester-DNA--protein-cysteine methyltransferase